MTYLWSTSETTQSIDVGLDTTTPYTVTVTRGAACSASDDHVATPCWRCTPVGASIDAVLPAPSTCFGTQLELQGSGVGEGVLRLEWDFDYDGLVFDVEATGGITPLPPPALGSRTAALRVTDACVVPQAAIASVRIEAWQLPSVTIQETCDLGQIRLDAFPIEGTPPHQLAWSTSESTPSIYVAPGTYSLTVTDAHGCTDGAQVLTSLDCRPPGEVSAPGRPQLLVTRSASGVALTFEEVARAASYGVLVNRLGTWSTPDAALSACDLAGLSPGPLAGTLVVNHPLAGSGWIVVTASNPNGEGPAGAGTDGERSQRAAWTGCGP